MAIGKPMFEYEVLPLLDNRRRGIPEQRKLEQDDVVVQQALLLDVDIDIKARVITIQVDESDAIDRSRYRSTKVTPSTAAAARAM
jgi:hypothetical protein